MRLKCIFVLLFLLLISLLSTAEGALIAKVTTPKGSLNLRRSSSPGSRIIARVPAGTCLSVLQTGNDFCLCEWNGKTGYCSTEFLTILQNADASILRYRVLQKGDSGEDVLALKKRLQELGYLRSGSSLSEYYNNVLTERVRMFQRQVGAPENGIASQEMQAFLYSDRAPRCTQTLPAVRSRVRSETGGMNREICGCCMGEGCECCNYTGWIVY